MSDYLTAKDLWKVQNILWEVCEKWFDIGLQLKLEPNNLNKIEVNFKTVEECCRKMLLTWLSQVDPKPTWAALVEALKSPPVKCEYVARKIELEHLQKPESSQNQVHLDENINNSQNPDFHDCEEDEEDSEVKVRMDELDERFSDLVDHAYRVLIKEQGLSVSDLRSHLDNFPSTRRHEHQEFLDKYIVRMGRDVTVYDLWSQLCSYWHFINYKLLEHIIRKSGCKKLIKKMKSYKEDLISFSKETSLHDFVKCFPKLCSKKLSLAAGSNHRLEVKVGGKICKLIDLDRLEKGFVSTFSLPKICGLILKNMSPGCLLVTWMVPAPYIKLLKWKLSICDEQFFKRHDVESVHLDGEVCYVRGSERTPINPAIELVSDIEITKNTFELGAMTKIVMESSIPLTMTQLCTAYTFKLLTHHLSHHPVHGKSNLRIQSFTDLPQDTHKQFLHLCQLAYKGILTRYRGTRSLLPEHIEGLGLTVDFEGSVYFIHRTLQEYLAAVYISNTIQEGITDYFEEFLNLPYFGYLPYFITGLTKLRFMTGQMLLKIRQRISKYLLMFESEFPRDLMKKTMSNLTEFTDIAIVNDVMSVLKRVELSTSSDIKSASTRSGLIVDSGLGHSSVGSRSASTRSDLSMDSGLGHSSVGSRSASTRSDLSMDSGLGHSSVGSRSASTRSDLSVDSRHASHSSFGFRLAFTRTMDSGLRHSNVGSRSPSTRSDLSVDSRLAHSFVGSRSPSTRSRLSIDSGLGHSSVGSRSASTRSDLSMDSGLGHSSVGSRSASTRSDLSMDSGLGHSSVGSRSASTRSDLSMDSGLGHSSVGSRSASTRFHLSINSGLGHSSVGSRSASTRSHLSVDDYFLNYSYYVTGRLLPLSDHNWKLKSMNEFMSKGFVDAIESVCNYKGVEFPSQNFKLTIDSYNYRRLSYLPYSILNRIEAMTLYNSFEEEISELECISDKLINLHEVYLKCRLNIVTPFLSHLKTLKILNLQLKEIRDDGASEIAITLLVNQSLEELNIKGNGITDRGASALAEGLKGNKTLKILNLAGNKIGDDGASEIAKTLLVNQSLEELNIKGNDITDRGASALAEGLKGNKTLKILNLGWNKICDYGVSKIAKTLLNQSLEELNITHNVITYRGASALAEGLKGNKTLKILNLGYNKICDDGASEIAKTLLVNQSLEELNIEHSDITYRGASALAEGLKGNKTLKILNLEWNKICDYGASEIAKTLLVNQSLEELNIEGNGITDRGASVLAEGLQGNKTLKILHLGWNKIGDDGANEIAKTLLVNQSLEELNIVITDRGASVLAEGRSSRKQNTENSQPASEIRIDTFSINEKSDFL